MDGRGLATRLPTGGHVLEDGAEATSSPVQAPAGGHGEAAHDGRDLRRREPLPFGEQQDLAVLPAEAEQRIVYERLLAAVRPARRHRSLARQPLLQREP